jgi:ribonuclease-3
MINFLKIFKKETAANKAFAAAIAKRLGYKPRDLELYKAALTHGSTLRNTAMLNCSERFEFLGDAVIEMIVSEYLYRKFSDQREGFLTQMRSRLVSRQNLAELSKRLNLQPLLLTYNVRITQNILSNAFEALIGAMYLDVGYAHTADYFIKNILEAAVDVNELQRRNINYKGQLMEMVQHRHWHAHFDTKDERRNPQEPMFHCLVRINGDMLGSGVGRTKKEAEQSAARKTLEELGNPPHDNAHTNPN